MLKKTKIPISINHLNWCFGAKVVLDDVSLQIDKGKFYCIIGPNGSGKTTLLKNLSKGLMPKKDCVYVQEMDITYCKNKEFAKKAAYVPQHIDSKLEFSVLDVVLMGRNPYLKRFKDESQVDIDIALDAMRQTNTLDLKDKNLTEVSGGERQRVIIARALAQQTDIILLDEPISSLDILHQSEVMDILKELTQTKGITVVSVLHDLNLASLYSDQVIMIHEGKVFSKGHATDVITKRNIKAVYGLNVHIMKHPYLARPQVVPMRNQTIHFDVAK